MNAWRAAASGALLPQKRTVYIVRFADASGVRLIADSQWLTP
jgi:hypothetical protein